MDDNVTLTLTKKVVAPRTAIAEAEAGDGATLGSGIDASTVGLGLLVLALIYLLVPMGGKKKNKSGPRGPRGLNASGGKKAIAKVEDDDEDSWAFKLADQNKRVAVFYGSQTGTSQEYALKWAKEARSKFGLSSLVLDPEQCEFNVLNRVPKDKAVVFVMASYGEGEPTDNAEVSWYQRTRLCEFRLFELTRPGHDAVPLRRRRRV